MKKIIFICLLFLGNMAVVFGQPLSYTRLTNGLTTPEFDKGRSGFCMDDINMDGHIDILTVGDHGSPNFGTTQHGIIVWFGDGHGNFENFMNGDFGYGSIVVGDVNGDGHKDVGYGIHHNYSSTNFGDQILEVALGDGTAQNWTTWDEGLATNGETYGMSGVDFGDVDNDGDLDLVSISFGAGAGVHVYLNQGDGTWQHSFGFLDGNSENQVEFADFNNDGYLDFAAAHAFGTVYFGDGTGNFVNNDLGLPALGASSSFRSISTGDVNNDGAGDLALVLVDGSAKVFVWADFDEQWVDFSGNLPTGGDYSYVALEDMNSDGFIDLIGMSNTAVDIFLGDGTGNWTLDASVTIPESGTPKAFQVGGDLDNNGRPDMVMLTLTGSFYSYKNKMFCFKESSAAESLWIQPRFPRGGENFHPGTAHFIKWASAVPAEGSSLVDIEISAFGPDGPWWLLAQDLPNNGKHQWVIPDYGSDQVHLRLIVKSEQFGADTTTSAAFNIFGEPTSVANSKPANQLLLFPNPGSDHIYLNDVTNIKSISFFDGKGIEVSVIHNPSDAVNVSQLPRGLYYLRFIFNDGTIRNEKWMKVYK
ncbi:MAG TPA: T9SS type A sorting domain-containing protein [Bacteroidales bacterium]|nr:T9SS type A sorting domain-containing protein [Bacteroidales bacterium]